jgi:hypothetical protein
MYADEYDDEEWEERVERFADPGGESALYAADRNNPRDQKCPTCGWPNVLTHLDVAAGYQCDSCANAAERGMDINYYEGDDDDPEEEPEPDRLSEADWR